MSKFSELEVGGVYLRLKIDPVILLGKCQQALSRGEQVSVSLFREDRTNDRQPHFKGVGVSLWKTVKREQQPVPQVAKDAYAHMEDMF